MTGLDIFKGCVGFVIGTGVSQIISGVVENNTDPDNFVQQATIFTGKVAISIIVKELVQERVNAKIDSAHAWYVKEIKEPLSDK